MILRARGFLALAVTLWVAAFARDSFDDWVDATELPSLILATSPEVRARDGSLLRAYTVADGRWRMAATVGEVDAEYLDLLIRYEDKRFYSHAGVDPVAVVRAFGQALRYGRVVSGGSTLTMQVARLLEESGTGKVGGKLRQMRVALALERRLTKDEILNLYLQLAPFGGNLEGVRAASFAYFGKEPRRLTAAEAALLVAIPQAPESRRPDRHADRAKAARERVLLRAVRDGILDYDEAQAALTERVPDARRDFPQLAPHLADRLRAADPLDMRIETTIDAALQTKLQKLAGEAVAGEGERLQVGIMVADHQTGEILASVGSAGYTGDARQGFVDMTQALRSPGSTLKPLVYALAFDEGLAHPETLIDDLPINIGGYAPQNFDKHYRGTVRIRQALQMSLNIPVVLITDAIGPARLLAAMDRAKIGYEIPPPGKPGLAIALGGLGVSLKDMVQLYAALARGGVALPLHVTGTGEEGQRLVSEVAAWQVADILSGMVPPPGSPENRLAYKTGTSYGHRDAWAIGFDGAHVAGVWLGRADGTPVPGAFGAETAAPLLFRVMGRIKPELRQLSPPPPATLLLSNAQLPQPLQKFRSRSAAFVVADAPAVDFPPDGAQVELLPEGLLVRVRGGKAPFTWLVDGLPLARNQQERAVILSLPGKGFITLSVIDALGRSARAKVQVR
jgi:penicillin-binding protein 1C